MRFNSLLTWSPAPKHPVSFRNLSYHGSQTYSGYHFVGTLKLLLSNFPLAAVHSVETQRSESFVPIEMQWHVERDPQMSQFDILDSWLSHFYRALARVRPYWSTETNCFGLKVCSFFSPEQLVISSGLRECIGCVLSHQSHLKSWHPDQIALFRKKKRVIYDPLPMFSLCPSFSRPTTSHQLIRNLTK